MYPLHSSFVTFSSIYNAIFALIQCSYVLQVRDQPLLILQY